MKQPVKPSMIPSESSAGDVKRGLDLMLKKQRENVESASEHNKQMKLPPFNSSTFKRLRKETADVLKEQRRRERELKLLLKLEITEENKNDILDMYNRIFGI